MTDAVDIELSTVIRDGLDQVLRKLLGSDDIDVKIESGSNKGDNFIGIVYRVSGTANGSTINVILKVAPRTEARREAFSSRVLFLREIKMYDEVLPMFRRFQESRGICVDKSGFHEYPKCYKTIDSDVDETVILEDLRRDRFEMFDRMQVIRIEHVRLIMSALGKYHAISFALRDQQPKVLEQFVDLEENFMRNVDDNVNVYFEQMLTRTYESLDQPGDEQLVAKVKKFFEPGHIALMRECCNGQLAEPYAVVAHGDCWTNNFLFKYDEKDNPIDLRLLDWQVSRYASPVTDIVYFIFACTTKPLRDEYYEDMIKTYHDSFSQMLTQLGSSPSKLFPFSALQAQLKRFGKFGFVTATLLLPMITMEAEKCPDLDEMVETFKNSDPADVSPFEPNAEAFNKRMRDVIVDMDRLGYMESSQ